MVCLGIDVAPLLEASLAREGHQTNGDTNSQMEGNCAMPLIQVKLIEEAFSTVQKAELPLQIEAPCRPKPPSRRK
jgi:hypothetical protein